MSYYIVLLNKVTSKIFILIYYLKELLKQVVNLYGYDGTKYTQTSQQISPFHIEKGSITKHTILTLGKWEGKLKHSEKCMCKRHFKWEPYCQWWKNNYIQQQKI